MTTLPPGSAPDERSATPRHNEDHTPMHGHAGHDGHGGHRWMMIACCVPMLLVAVTLVIAGVANAGAVFFALACFAMMAVMMAGMGHGGGRK